MAADPDKIAYRTQLGIWTFLLCFSLFLLLAGIGGTSGLFGGLHAVAEDIDIHTTQSAITLIICGIVGALICLGGVIATIEDIHVREGIRRILGFRKPGETASHPHSMNSVTSATALGAGVLPHGLPAESNRHRRGSPSSPTAVHLASQAQPAALLKAAEYPPIALPPGTDARVVQGPNGEQRIEL